MKKIWCILLSAFMLLYSLPTYAAGSTDYASAYQTVKALGIVSADVYATSNVTRGEFAKMLVMASVYREEVSGEAFSSVYPDVSSSNTYSEYIRIAVENGWMTGYVDGNFRPFQAVKTEEAVTALLSLLGYDPASLAGVFPSAQISKAKAVGLGDGITLTKGASLTVQDCVYLFYHLMNAETASGSVYAQTLGYSVTNDTIDYSSLVSEDLKGPFVLESADSLASAVPFDLGTATIYRNGMTSEASDAQAYDVYYYNEGLRTVWLYSNHVTGTYTAASPDAAAPQTATVAGNTYTLEGTAAYKLSTMGEFHIGDVVTLLIGMNGTAVDVISPTEYDTTYYGVVTVSGVNSYTTESGSVQVEKVVYVACTDGTQRSYSTDESFEAGDIVSITFTTEGTKITQRSKRTLSGRVSSDGTSLGGKTFASDVKILHVSEGYGTTKIYPSKLIGTSIASNQVWYYATNSKGEITDLLLYNLISEGSQIGVITSVTEVTSATTDAQGNPATESAYQYSYILNGVSGQGTTTQTVKTGAALFATEDGKTVFDYNLSSTTLTEVDYLYAYHNNTKYSVSEDVQCYVRSTGGTYTEINISSLRNFDDYTMTGYLYKDNICVIIARQK